MRETLSGVYKFELVWYNIRPSHVEYRYIIAPEVGIFPEVEGRGKYSQPRMQHAPIFHKEGLSIYFIT